MKRQQNVIAVHAGSHKGIWIRDEEHRDRLYKTMRNWPQEIKAIASQLPVRIAATPEGWEHVKMLAANEAEFARSLRAGDIELNEPDMPSWADFDDEDGPTTPMPPHGLFPVFVRETEMAADGYIGVTEICADGARYSLGGG
jgi:hypothetical protein